MKKALMSLALILGLTATVATPVNAQAIASFTGHNQHHNGQHHGGKHHHHGGQNHHQNHRGQARFPFPIPIPIPVPVPTPYPGPNYPGPNYPGPDYPCTPGYDCHRQDVIRVWVWETRIVRDPFPRKVKYQRLVTARWDYRYGGYWYYNNYGDYVRVR